MHDWTLALTLALGMTFAALAEDSGCTTANWIGGASGNYSNANNWDVPIAPIDGALCFDVVISDGISVTFEVPGVSEITSLSLGANSVLTMQPGTDLTVISEAAIAGRIAGTDGRFTSLIASFVGNRASVQPVTSVADIAEVIIGAPLYDSRGFWADNGFNSIATYDWTLLHASGIDTLLDLSAVETFHAGFNSGGNDRDRQHVYALDGAAIDLSGVLTLHTPFDYIDFVEFYLEDGGSIDLSALDTITTTGKGYAQFDVTNAQLSLPSLAVMKQTQFIVDGGSLVEANTVPALYDSRGFWLDNGFNSVDTYDWTLLQASGIDTLLDLSAVETFHAGFNSGGNDRDRQHVYALDGAAIDLSGVLTLHTPFDYIDFVEFYLEDGGSIDLSALDTITTTGKGYAQFDVTNAQLSLPSLAVMKQTQFIVDGGSLVEVNTVPALYDSRGFWLDNGFNSVDTYNWTLLQASGADTLLDLSAVETFHAGFNSGGNDRDRHHVNATDDATIDLSGVQVLHAPVDYIDSVEFNLDNGGSVDLSALDTITTTGKGYAQFDVTNAQLSLPSLAAIEQTQFIVDGGSLVEVNTVPVTYDSTGFWLDNGFNSVDTYNWTLIQASGVDTLLDLSAIHTIDAGFNSTGNDNDRHHIYVLDGAMLDLAALTTVIDPVDGQDWVDATVSGGSTLHTGCWEDYAGLRVLTVTGDGSTVTVDGDLRSGAPLTIDIAGTNTIFDTSGSLLISSNIGLNTTPGTTFRIGRRLCTAHTGPDGEDQARLDESTVHFDRTGIARLEVGGFEAGPFCIGLNFGIGRLIVGDDGTETTLRLVDTVENDPNTTNAEALYLYGLADGSAPLEFRGDATLVLNGLNVYVCEDDGVTHLNALFEPGEIEIEYLGGTIALGIPNARGDVTEDGQVNIDDLLAVLAAWGPCPCGDECLADPNCDGVVNVDDLLTVIGSFVF